MNLTYLLSGRKPVPATWTETIQGFTAFWTLTMDHFDVTITDPATDEPYLPFELKRSNGAFVNELRAQVLNRAADIINERTAPDSLRDTVIRYAIDTYGTVPENPWNDENITLNKVITHPSGRETQKWYGIIMRIKRKSLGEKDPVLAQAEVDVINIKASSADIARVDGITLYPAYHMNKKNWLTILLSSNDNWSSVQDLIDKSWRLVH